MFSVMSNNFKALPFQMKIMQQNLSSIDAEFIYIDATYELLDIRTPVLIIINEDRNGFLKIVAVGITVQEGNNEKMLFFPKFKENNSKFRKAY